jgi:hypothetical protein
MAALALLGACAHGNGSQANVSISESLGGLADHRVANLSDIEAEARWTMGTYLESGENTRRHRTWINLGIWGANTFVTAASGLEAHPDSIFAGSMVGQALFGLDPIVNAGGTAAWSQAYARTSCIVGFVNIANTGQAQRDLSLVSSAGTAESAAAYTNYMRLVSFAHSEIVATYAAYLTARTSALIDAKNAPEAATEEPAGVLDVDELPAAILRLNTLVEAARTGITECRPGAAPAPEAAHTPAS